MPKKDEQTSVSGRLAKNKRARDMYEERRFVSAELVDHIDQGGRAEQGKPDLSVIILRNIMLWGSAAVSCAFIYMILSALT
jgi:hypothetical protein